MDRVTFGKHSGNTWFWVMENFPDYIIWCVGNTDMKFSYQLIVDAIKSKYKKKADAKSEEKDRDNEANAHIPKRTISGIGDLFARIEDKHSNGFQGRPDGFADWDDDVPF